MSYTNVMQVKHHTRMYKTLSSVLVGLIALPTLANTKAQTTSNEPTPKWFLENVESEKRKGCSEDWSKFYWAKRLPVTRLQVSCMADGRLHVAPRLGSMHRNTYWYGGTFPFDNVLESKIGQSNRPGFDLVYHTTETFDAKKVYEENKNVTPVLITGTSLIIVKSNSTAFCAVERNLISAKTWPINSIWACGYYRNNKPTITSISFAVDGKTSVLVRAHEGIPSEVDVLKFSKKVLSFLQSLRNK